MNRIFKFFSSLRLTVVCLGFGIVLVFIGTLAQVNEGLYMAQSRWFRSFFIWWGPQGAGWQVPIFPGGYLIGIVLLLNLIAAHLKRFKLSWKKLGINVTHAGIILLLLGQLITDIFSRETQVHFAEGETKSYSESFLQNELVFMTDSAKPGEDEVISIPESFLKNQKEIRHDKLPFTVGIKQYHVNANVRERSPMFDTNTPPVSTKGVGPRAIVEPKAMSKETDKRNLPSAVLELSSAKSALGSWLVSPIVEPQAFEVDGKRWRVALRGERSYFPYTIQLLKTTHEVYPGTDLPKNFQSRVRIENPGSGENREVDIYMNSPLRYAGQTFFQYQMGRDEVNMNLGTSALQVVKNPGWMTPYVGCIMVGGGMAIQFLMHLVGFVSKRRTA